MGVVAGPKARLLTLDPVTGNRINLFQLTSNNNLVVYPACNGRIIWLTRLTTNNVVPLDLESLTFGTAISIGTDPVGIWDDERYLWSLSSAGVLRRIDLATGTTIESISLTAGTYGGITGDKRYLWVMNATNVLQVDRETGTIVGSFTKPTNAKDLHHDRRFLWILTGANSTTGTIKQYDPVTGTQIGSFNITTYGLSDNAAGLTGDERYLYSTELVQ